MSTIPSNTIGYRLLRIVFGCYFLVALAGTVTQLVFEYSNTKRDSFIELSDLGQTLESNLIQGLWNYDIDQIDSAISGIEKNSIIKATKVTTPDGQVVSGSSQQLLSTHTDNDRDLEGDYGHGAITRIKRKNVELKNTLYEYKFSLTYVNADQSIEDLVGFGYFYTDHAHILNKVKYSFALIIVNSIVKTIALWCIFLFFVNRIISKPLQLLTGAAEAFDPKNARSLVNKDGLEAISNREVTDELSTLVNSFNSMRDSATDSYKIIESQNENLEKRVVERTKSIEKINKQLEKISLHDSLTELPNRKLFEERLNHTLSQANLSNAHFAVAILDLRKFKDINDSMGHQAGDHVLQEVAMRMFAIIDGIGLIARMGGDEFAVILNNAGPDEARSVSEKIIASSSEPILLEGWKMYVGINIGLSFYPEHGKSAQALLKKADIAMYQSKQLDNGFALYNASIEENMERRETIESSLARNDFLDQLEVFYQPIICKNDRRIKGFEALVRWHHPELGFIPPDEFIPVTERSQAIRLLTSWVSLKAMQDAQALNKLGYDFSISVNLSGRLVSDSSFSEELHQLLLKSEIDPGHVIFEITETIAMSNPEKTLEILKRLKKIGVKLSIDDFGTGYSSLAYLTRLPVDELKIDRSFLLDTSPNSKIVIQSIIDIAHRLNLKVVAEGVENENIIEALESFGCDYFQGYHYSPPVNFETLVQWVENYNAMRLDNSQFRDAS